MHPREIARDLGISCRDLDLAARLHRIARVDHEVHQHLFELATVPTYRAHEGLERHRELDVVPQQPVEQALDALDHRVGTQVLEG